MIGQFKELYFHLKFMSFITICFLGQKKNWEQKHITPLIFMGWVQVTPSIILSNATPTNSF